jgi:AraC-like DNA-binding protein
VKKTAHEINVDGVCLLKMFRTRVKKGLRMNRVHRHTALEISTMIKGSGEYTTERTTYKMEQGDVFLYRANEQHCITCTKSDEMELLTMRFEPRFIWGSGNRMFDFKFLNFFLNKSTSFSNRLPADTPSVEKITALLKEIEKEFKHKKTEYELMVKVRLLNLLVLLVRDFDAADEQKFISPRGQNIKSMEKAMNYIDSHLCDNFTLEEIARIAAMSKAYFSTAFKRLNGISLWDYITIKRIDKAIDLLSETDKTILEIALLCGYNNTANFNRAFRKITQKTPRDYRNAEA